MDNLMRLRNLYRQEKYKNYNKNFVKENKFLAKYIHENYDSLSDYEIKQLATKCISENIMKKYILKYELIHHKIEPKDKLTLKEFQSEALKILQKYQSRAGGFYIEDNKWHPFNHKTEKHVVKKNELLFENTVQFQDYNDIETQEYLSLITNRLNQIAKNIKVQHDCSEDKKNDVVWIFIWCVDKSMKTKKSALISL